MDDQAPAPDQPAPDQPAPGATGAVPPPPPPGPAGPATVVADDATPVPPPPPPPPTPAPAEADREKPGRPGLVGALTTVGVGLLAAAVVLSTWNSRADGDLDWSNYFVGLGATAVLVLVALVAVVVVRRKHDPVARGELVTWPGVVGILGVAAMLAVGVADQGWTDDYLAYVEGGLVTALAVLGYLASRRAAYVVTAIGGVAILYVQGFDDLFGDSLDEDSTVITVALAVTVFVVGVTVLGWLLPTRAISGVVVGVAGVVAFAALMVGMLAAQAFAGFFGPTEMMFGTEDGSTADFAPPSSPSFDFDNDVWVVLGLAALLTVFWALAAAWTGNSGFTIAAILMPAIVVPLAVAVLTVEHPTWWGAAVAAGGAVLLALGGLLGRSRARSAAEPAY
ncbi:MAG TPA: hypothetical protein VNS55_01110 [Nocardioides sp.]|nr:hypothetical protein [Nocardioides sp.]